MQHLFGVIVVTCVVFTLTRADFRTDALDLHNRYRAKHQAPPLALDNSLNNYAQNWAQNMARSNGMRHSNGKYGENLYMSSDTRMSDSDIVKKAITRWYNEVSQYRWGSGFSMATGHFTQLVWKNSRRLGIGIARSPRAVFVCASYDPRGNTANQFGQNVLNSQGNTGNQFGQNVWNPRGNTGNQFGPNVWNQRGNTGNLFGPNVLRP